MQTLDFLSQKRNVQLKNIRNFFCQSLSRMKIISIIILYCAFVSISHGQKNGVCFRQVDKLTGRFTCSCFGETANWARCTATSNELRLRKNGEICFRYSDKEQAKMGCRCPKNQITSLSISELTIVDLQLRSTGGVCLGFFNHVRNRKECNCLLTGVALKSFKKTTLVLSGAASLAPSVAPTRPVKTTAKTQLIQKTPKTINVPLNILGLNVPGITRKATGVCYKQRNPQNKKLICMCYGISATWTTCGIRGLTEFFAQPKGGVCANHYDSKTGRNECRCPLLRLNLDSCKVSTLVLDGGPPPRHKLYSLGQGSPTTCTKTTCKNRGKCTQTIAVGTGERGFKCTCRSRYGGTRCEKLRNPCQSSPCHNGGYCIPKGYTFRCECKSGYKGKLCRHGGNTCRCPKDNSPCRPLPSGNGYSCSHAKGK